MPQIKLRHTTIDYRAEGIGPPAVLVHGLLVNGKLWDGIRPSARCRAYEEVWRC